MERFAAAKQLMTPFSTIWCENGLKGRFQSVLSNATGTEQKKGSWKKWPATTFQSGRTDSLGELEQVHCMEKNFRFLLVRQALGDIAKAGIENAGVDDILGRRGGHSAQRRSRAREMPRGFMVRMGVWVLWSHSLLVCRPWASSSQSLPLDFFG